MLPKALAHRTAFAAGRFHDRMPWQDFDEWHLFACVIPAEPHPVFAVVLGSEGVEFGLVLACGERAREQLGHLSVAGAHAPVVAPMLLLTFDELAQVPKAYRELAERGAAQGLAQPVAYAVPLSGGVRPPRPAELQILAQVLEVLVAGDVADILQPRWFRLFEAAKVLTLTWRGTAEELHSVSARFVAVPEVTERWRPKTPLPWPLGVLPVQDRRVRLAFEPVLGPDDGAGSGRGFLCACDAGDGFLLGAEPLVLGGADERAAVLAAMARLFAAPARGEPGLPRLLLLVSPCLFDACARLFERGVFTCDEDGGLTRRGFVSFAQHVQRTARGAVVATDVPDGRDGALWLRHHERLYERLLEAIDPVLVWQPRAIRRYFGVASGIQDLDDAGLETHRRAYREWYALCYRHGPGQPTVGERLLAGPLPSAERCLLEAWLAAPVSLYVVQTVRPPLLLLRDVFAEEQIVLRDACSSLRLRRGAALPARIGSAKGHRFLVPAGPLLRGDAIRTALGDLWRRHGTLTAADLRQQPERLGTCWLQFLQSPMDPLAMLLSVTKGMFGHFTATYRVADWRALRRALRRREDISFVNEFAWEWAQPQPRGERMVAQIERVVDELLVHSEVRPWLYQVRSWLEKIPGLQFVSMRAMPPRPRRRRPRSDRATLPAGLLAFAEEALARRYLRRLREPMREFG
ncbi:MAG: hypothetical protein JNK49_15765, partial [Planctomycetes bacterium]|nr:hypothetical protein [Planctomycetota bacterium]